MTIRAQSFLCIAIATVVLLGGALLTLRTVLINQFADWEQSYALRDAERARQAVSHQIAQLRRLAHDWAQGNTTYQFPTATGQARRDFIQSQLQASVLASNGLQALAFLDHSGNMLWSNGYDPATGRLVGLPQGLIDTIARTDVLDSPPDKGLAGVLSIPEGIMLVSAFSSHRISGEDAPAGVLIMGRFIRDAPLADMEAMTQLELSFHTDAEHDPEHDAWGNATRVVENGKSLLVEAPIQDIFGKYSVHLSLTLPRTIMLFGKEALFASLLVIFVCIVSLSGVILWILESRVLSRIRSLHGQATRLAAMSAHGQPIYLQGNDEVASLARSINSLLQALEAMRLTQAEQYETLQQEEKFLETVLDSVQAGIVQIDAKTRTIIKANAFAERLAEWPRGHLKGKPCHGFLCGGNDAHCALTDLDHTIDLTEALLVNSSNTATPILKSVTCIEHHGRATLLVTFVDISELHKAQEKLRISEKTYRTIFNSSGAAMVMLDDQGHVTLANEEFARMAGVPSEMLERTPPHWTAFFPDDAQPGIEAMLKHSIDRVAKLESTFLRNDGTTCHVTFTVADLPQPGWHILSLLDITSRRKTEAALQRAHDTLEQTVSERTRELEQAVKRLTELDSLKSAFLSSASHELRTPLTSIMGFAKLMERSFTRHFLPLAAKADAKERAEEHVRNLKIMQEEGARLTRLVNDLLDLNAIESGSMHWQLDQVDVAGIIREALEALGPNALQPGVALQLEISNHLPTIQADADRMRQLFHNLLSNAAKFTTEGRIRLHADVNQRSHCVEIIVEDTGIGIDSKHLKHIFDRFYQRAPGMDADDHLRDKPRGAGLGLAICREIVEHYGGHITASSTLGVGSTFTVMLPLALSNLDTTLTKSADAKPAQG